MEQTKIRLIFSLAAISLAATVASIKPAQADFNAAITAYAQGNFTAAFQDFLVLAKQGDVMAQDIVAFMYHRGNGVKKDDVQAYMWLDSAARAGDPDAAKFRDEIIAPDMTQSEIAKAKELSKSSALQGENGSSPSAENTSAPPEEKPIAKPMEQPGPDNLPSPKQSFGSAQAGAPRVAQPPSPHVEQQSLSQIDQPPSSEARQSSPASADLPSPAEAGSAKVGPPVKITSDSPEEKPIEKPKSDNQAPIEQRPLSQTEQPQLSQIEQSPLSKTRQSPPPPEAQQSSAPSEAPQTPPPSHIAPSPVALAKAPESRAAPSHASAQQSPNRDWTMQLAAMPDEPQAQREWERLRKAYPDLLGELTLMVERVELSDKHQTFYRVRVGNWKDVKAPTALCDKLKQRGARCFVVRRSS